MGKALPNKYLIFWEKPSAHSYELGKEVLGGENVHDAHKRFDKRWPGRRITAIQLVTWNGQTGTYDPVPDVKPVCWNHKTRSYVPVKLG